MCGNWGTDARRYRDESDYWDYWFRRERDAWEQIVLGINNKTRYRLLGEVL